MTDLWISKGADPEDAYPDPGACASCGDWPAWREEATGMDWCVNCGGTPPVPPRARRWTAAIEVDGVRLDATQSERDLLKDQTQQASRDVMALGGSGTVVVYSETKARGLVADRMYQVRNGRIDGGYQPDASWAVSR